MKHLRAEDNVSGQQRNHLLSEILNPHKHMCTFPKGISQMLQIQPWQEFIGGVGEWGWGRAGRGSRTCCRQSYGIPSALLDLSIDQGKEIGFLSHSSAKMFLTLPCCCHSAHFPSRALLLQVKVESAPSSPLWATACRGRSPVTLHNHFPSITLTQAPADLCTAVCKLSCKDQILYQVKSGPPMLHGPACMSSFDEQILIGFRLIRYPSGGFLSFSPISELLKDLILTQASISPGNIASLDLQEPQALLCSPLISALHSKAPLSCSGFVQSMELLNFL